MHSCFPDILLCVLSTCASFLTIFLVIRPFACELISANPINCVPLSTFLCFMVPFPPKWFHFPRLLSQRHFYRSYAFKEKRLKNGPKNACKSVRRKRSTRLKSSSCLLRSSLNPLTSLWLLSAKRCLMNNLM